MRAIGLAALLITSAAFADQPLPLPPVQGAELTQPPPDQRAARAHVAFAPQRYDDILWENDRTAHRIYGPALQVHEPPSGSGIDAWGKRVAWPFMERQLATGHQHDYHGEGLDFYNVGGSRGGGGLGIWYDHKLWTSRNWQQYHILRDGPDRADFTVDYAAWPVDVLRRVWEHRRFVLPLGSNFTRISSTIGSDKPGMMLVGIGLASHPTDGGKGRLVADRAHGRFTFWSPEDREKGAMGTALIVDPAQIAEVTEDADNYLVVIKVRPSHRFAYYMGATWSRAGQFADAAAWATEVAAQHPDFAAP